MTYDDACVTAFTHHCPSTGTGAGGVSGLGVSRDVCAALVTAMNCVPAKLKLFEAEVQVLVRAASLRDCFKTDA